MIRALFGFYGNQNEVNALCGKFYFSLSDMLESKSLLSVLLELILQQSHSFSEHFDTNIRKIDQWMTKLGQELQKFA